MQERVMLIDRRTIAHFDWMLLLSALVIPAAGLIVLYSAGHDPDASQKVFPWLPFESYSPAFARQLVFILAGSLLILAGVMIPSQVLHRYSYLVYGACVTALVLVAAVGVTAKGSQRWLSIAGITFQPSEMMKLALVIGMARFLAHHPPPPGGYRFLQLFAPFALIAVPMGLIAMQPDLGTAISVGAVGFCMMLFMGIRLSSLAAMAAAVVAVLVPFWEVLLKPYQKRRILVLFNPDVDPLGSGYHIIQSKIAVGSGQLFGKGFMQGTQTQLEFLPEHTTDFIFSVLSEEWGFAGAMLLIALFLLLFYRLLKVVMRSRDLFAGLVALGISAQLFVNAFINMAMVVGILPVVGIPLPLVSYGGTSLLSMMFSLGIVLGISMRRHLYAGR